MRINIAELQASIAANIGAIPKQASKSTEQINTIYKTINSSDFLKSEAYSRVYAYLAHVKIPVLKQHVVFLDVLSKNMRKDLRRLSELRMTVGASVDTDALQQQITEIHELNSKLEIWKKAFGMTIIGPIAGLIINAIIGNNDRTVQQIQNKIDLTLAYANDSSIYADSGAESQRLNAAMKALGDAAYDPNLNAYRIGNVSDWSWRNNISKRYNESLPDLQRLQQYGISAGGTAFGGDPVNLATGNFVFQKTYLEEKGLHPFSFKPFYNSEAAARSGEHGDGPALMGRGWTHELALSITRNDDEVALRRSDGSTIFFFPVEGEEDRPIDQGAVMGESRATVFASDSDPAGRIEALEDGYRYLDGSGACYSFNADGLLTSQQNASGNELVLSYGPNDELLAVTSSSGESLAFEYDATGETLQLSAVSDHAGRAVQLSYAGESLESITDERGNVYRFTCDDLGRIISIDNPAGFRSLENRYDEEGRIAGQILANGQELHYEYDESGNLALAPEEGMSTRYEHDESFHTTAISNLLGAEAFSYDSMGNRVSHTDQNGNTTTYSYDENGRICSATNALGETLTIVRDTEGRVAKASIEDVLLFANEYDERGNLVSQADALGHTTAYRYDDNGNLVKVVRPDGSFACVQRDERGNIVEAVDASGVRTRYEYDELNNMTAIMFPTGDRTVFEMDERGNVVRMTNPERATRSYSFDENGRIVRITDFDGLSISRTYDKMGMTVTATNKDGSVVSFEYDGHQNRTARIDELGNKTVFAYDDLGRCVKETDPLGYAREFSYDACGNLIETRDALGGVQTIEYDALNRPIAHTDESGFKTSLEYDKLGNVTRIVDALGGERTLSYNDAGQGVELRDVAGNVTSFERDELGNITKETDALGRTRTYSYYPGGRLKEAIDYDGTWERFEYDKLGNVSRRSRQDGMSVSYVYDKMNRVTAISSSTGQSKRFKYDIVGNITATVEANGAATHYEYTPTGKLSAVIDALGARVEYEHDARGDLVEIRTMPAGSAMAEGARQEPGVIRYKRDAAGRVVSMVDELGREETYEHDALGRVVSMTDRDGFTTRYTYTPTGLLESTRYADGREVRLHYDALHRLVRMEDWLGETLIDRDVAGRIVKVRGHEGREISYEIGKLGQRLGMTYPDGTHVSYRYDKALRLTSIESSGLTAKYRYDENGRLKHKALSNSCGTRYSYNERGLLDEMTHYDAHGTVEECRFLYDAIGNRNQIERSRRTDASASGSFAYEYDALGRLVTTLKDGEMLRRYDYDGFGNRTYLWESGRETRSEFNAANQLIHNECGSKSTEYRYDGRGNLVQEVENGEPIRTYLYDTANKLVASLGSNGAAASYSFNGLGYRTNSRWYDLSSSANLDEFIGEHDASREAFARIEPLESVQHVHDLTRSHHSDVEDIVKSGDKGDVRNFLLDARVFGMLDGTTSSIFLNDSLGSPVHHLGLNGEVIESFTYDEFGRDAGGSERHRAVAGARNQRPFGFAGYRRDAFNDMLHSQARTYLPQLGRFSARDADKYRRPTLAMSFNQYIYCFDSPVVFIDPDGHDCYIFYLPEWVDEALADQKTLAAYYGIDVSEVHLIPIKNNADLISGWNSMGIEGGNHVDIQAVVINTHADPYGLGFGGNSRDSFTAVNVQSLDHKDVESLTLYGCNAGHLDYIGENIASQFAGVVNGAPVTASDGTVYSIAPSTGSGPYSYEPRGDETFKRWLRYGDRDAEGWHVYRYENGRLVVSESIGFRRTVAEMLNFCPA